jgi:hypothetical protein
MFVLNFLPFPLSKISIRHKINPTSIQNRKEELSAEINRSNEMFNERMQGA